MAEGVDNVWGLSHVYPPLFEHPLAQVRLPTLNTYTSPFMFTLPHGTLPMPQDSRSSLNGHRTVLEQQPA